MHKHFFYRKESWKTTWRLRIAVLVCAIALFVPARGWLAAGLGERLVCGGDPRPSDALLVENLDPSYPVFEHAASLASAGLASRVIVPLLPAHGGEKANQVSRGVADLMATVAGLEVTDRVPIQEVEPITLNAAYALRDFLARERLQSVIVVTPALRSRRSLVIYESVFSPAGIAVSCAPVVERDEGWIRSWHGIQEVTLQTGKLLYYRLWVLPFGAS